jgi:ribosomal protein S18 acetylase RimI-like enzyme
MSFNLTVRRATPADASELGRMQRAFVEHHEALDRHMRFNRAVTDSFDTLVPDVLENADQVLLVADPGGDRLAGFLWGMIRDNAPMLLPARYGYIAQTWTEGDARRHGIASRMVQEARAWFRGKGVDVVKLHVLHRNPGGRSFWERQDFDEFFHELWHDLP